MTVSSRISWTGSSQDHMFTVDPQLNKGTKEAWAEVCSNSKKKSKPDPVVYGFSPIAARLSGVQSRPDYINSSESADLFGMLERLVITPGHQVLSLDVFDTLVLRNNKSEAYRYLELSERILERLRTEKVVADDATLTATDLCLARIAGMQVSYRIRKPVSGCVEGSIAEVIAVQIAILNLPEECDALFLEEEIGYEIDNLTPNQVLIDIASKFTRAGGQVVLVSDMYLDGDSIEKIVNGVICKRIWKKIYSSSDLIVSKRSGKIFKKVEKDLDVESTGFVHLGDSFTGDVMKPRQAGWSAIHFPVSEYELVDRRANLDEFIVMMANKGFDVSGWAKI